MSLCSRRSFKEEELWTFAGPVPVQVKVLVFLLDGFIYLHIRTGFSGFNCFITS